jgi:hypothetical protein
VTLQPSSLPQPPPLQQQQQQQQQTLWKLRLWTQLGFWWATARG